MFAAHRSPRYADYFNITLPLVSLYMPLMCGAAEFGQKIRIIEKAQKDGVVSPAEAQRAKMATINYYAD